MVAEDMWYLLKFSYSTQQIAQIPCMPESLAVMCNLSGSDMMAGMCYGKI